MAVPKYKKSKAKQRSRRADWERLRKPDLGSCDNCGSAVQPHQVCMECGYYDGRQVLDIEE